jgi:hypothetical protein
MKKTCYLINCFLLLLLMAPKQSWGQDLSRFEKPPILPAAELVPPSLLSGNGFHVNQQVPTDGLMAHFTI